MAEREFTGILRNTWQKPLHCQDSGLRIGGGVFVRDPLSTPGTKQIDPGQQGDWKSESDEFLHGTAGHAIWSTKAFRNTGQGIQEISQFIRIGWNIPFIADPWTTFITCGVTSSDPREPTFGNNPDPVLGVEVSARMEDGSSVLAEGMFLSAYVWALPFSWLLHLFGDPQLVTHPRIQFTVFDREEREATGTTQGGLQFPSAAPETPDALMAQSFRHRATLSAQMGFAGAFPNFYEATYGLDTVGGTIFLKGGEVSWRDVPVAELGGASTTNFGDLMRAVNTYATREGFAGGFPTGFQADYGRGPVCGCVLLPAAAAEWRDVPRQALDNVPLEDVAGRFRAAHDYAVREGFVGGFPTLFHRTEADAGPFPTGLTGTVYGVVLVRPGFGEWRDVLLFRQPS
ncbi:hypothetical protein [Sinorhizobium fredii]|uniref:hypothetical protein n=1 Tax=Rhizobium fredii TaxID=380 RepID=UPI001295FB78|nr:hypothetical protein [Sinorhizobium fredii]MQW94004.1 hypothetical protein [Sinorhizobium fredii]